ncbi:hypothetical protein KB206_17985 [Microvirga sp. STS02]|uniref:hypothetical protein n=1 Tax=Hymenobacter negativus TaxID=2795026 RepID=UPI0018DD18EC|nr:MULTISPECIES: hypothetical protein [Bacteria]MBH8570789.1 hypothetical protein [Hymenobacter negativus]MBR7210526.1 hypothetical protein [Microvirga sp. STS02]
MPETGQLVSECGEGKKTGPSGVFSWPNVEECVWQMQLNKCPEMPDLAVFASTVSGVYTLAAHALISYSSLKQVAKAFSVFVPLAKKQ